MSEESRAKNMSRAVVVLYIIGIGLFLLFFSSSLLSRERKRKKNRRLCPWAQLPNANVLVHSSLPFFFSSSPRLIVDSYLLLSFFLYSRLFVVAQESAKKN